jgi:hypothetical protein
VVAEGDLDLDAEPVRRLRVEDRRVVARERRRPDRPLARVVAAGVVVDVLDVEVGVGVREPDAAGRTFA